MELERPLADWKGEHIGQEKQVLFQHAADTAMAVTKSDPGNVEAWADLAMSELAREHFPEAVAAAERALKLRADHARALAVRGSVSLQERKLNPALADFRRALSGTPENYLAAIGIAKIYLALEHYEESLAAFDHVVKIAVTDWQRVEGHLGRARSLDRLGQIEEARRARQTARQIDPRTGKADEMP
jgi:tetratricopeptide (TPR) repeat protein